MSRRAARTTSLGGSLSTSFLDVLSNGLGAGILLMVVISALPTNISGKSVSDRPFLRATWTVKGDRGALLAIAITSPVGTRNFDLRDSQIATKPLCDWAGTLRTGRVLLYGFVASGANAALSQPDGNNPPIDRTYVVWIQEPIPGNWSFRITYANRDDSLRQSLSINNIEISGSTSGGDGPVNFDRQTLSFGSSKVMLTSVPIYESNDDAAVRPCD